MRSHIADVYSNPSRFSLAHIGKSFDGLVRQFPGIEPRAEFVENRQMLSADACKLGIYLIADSTVTLVRMNG